MYYYRTDGHQYTGFYLYHEDEKKYLYIVDEKKKYSQYVYNVGRVIEEKGFNGLLNSKNYYYDNEYRDNKIGNLSIDKILEMFPEKIRKEIEYVTGTGIRNDFGDIFNVRPILRECRDMYNVLINIFNNSNDVSKIMGHWFLNNKKNYSFKNHIYGFGEGFISGSLGKPVYKVYDSINKEKYE